jgi:UDP:flavonoid glycosyltransferase YjiC (YdhE family)
MRIGIQTWGTEGDYRPFLTLAQTLQRRGHAVELVYTGVEGKDFTALSRGAGVETHFVDDGYFVQHKEELARIARDSLKYGNPRKQLELILSGLMDPVIGSMLDAARGLAERCDVIVGHLFAHSAAAAAEAQGKPFVMVAMQPVFTSRHYPPAGAPSLGGFWNALMWRIANGIMSGALFGRVNETRRRCGLAPLQRLQVGDLGDPRSILVAVSPSLFPRPPDWGPRIQVSGFLGLEETAQPWEPEPHVRRFLDEGPPVYLSFGSMFGMNERQTREAIDIFAAALTLAGARGIVQASASMIAQAPRQDNVCYIERAPHAQLFPRCAAIVHHGGAGTTQSAILAGRGSVIIPHAADQFYWGDLLHARGIAARPLKRTRLAARPLAARIRTVLDDPAITQRAGQLADVIRAERGPERAAELIEAAAQPGAARPTPAPGR